MRPGIVAVTLSAYGRAGPWAARRGFNSLVQTASGLNHAEAEAAGACGPKELPAQALDHATGYLMAFGAMMALARKAREGGSWHVRVSLAQTGHWLDRLGRLENGFACPEPTCADIADLLDETDTPFGRLTFVRHAAAALRDARALGPPARAARHPRAGVAGVGAPHPREDGERGNAHRRLRGLLRLLLHRRPPRRGQRRRAQTSISSGSSNRRSGTRQ